MTDKECMDHLGESKKDIHQRFSYAAQQALRNAQFLKTTDLVALQALTLYIVSQSGLSIRRWIEEEKVRRLSRTS